MKSALSINGRNCEMKKILFIVGSASEHSSILSLVESLADKMEAVFQCEIFTGLKTLPHFDPELSVAHTPEEIIDFRNLIVSADGIVICSPEYVFSIPSGLKNALEWCVSTTVLSEKPLGIITASADGRKGHEELQLILKTLMCDFTENTTLLISGIKGKIDTNGTILDHQTAVDLRNFMHSFKELLNK